MKIKLTFALIPVLALAGCASRKAGELTAKAQTEFKTYQANADAKVQQAEDARLELELRIVQHDAAALIASGRRTPEVASSEIVGQVMAKVEAYRARLAVWHGTDNSAAMINLALAAVNKYHQTGVTADDLIPSIDALGDAAPSIIKILRTESDYNHAQ